MNVTVLGAGGFIGGHLVNRLVADGHQVTAVDRKPFDEWHQTNPGVAGTVYADLRDPDAAYRAIREGGKDRVYNLAADMGGIGFIEGNKAACGRNVLVTTNVLDACIYHEVQRLFYSSSACVYPAGAQTEAAVTALAEAIAIPAEPEDGYGWEKLYGELMHRWYYEDYGLETRVARFHNIYGTHTEYEGGREKAPAALCRKVARQMLYGEPIAVWGDGNQTRSFCYVDDCVEGVLRLTESDVREPVNIGSDELVTINELVDTIGFIAGHQPIIDHDLDAPQGVRGRNSDNTLIRSLLGWAPSTSLLEGLEPTFLWVRDKVAQ